MVPKLDIVLPPSADGASFELFRAASAAHAQIALPEGACADDFFVDAATWQLPHAMLSRVRSSAQVISRGPAEIAADVAPTLQMYLQVAGEVDAVVGARHERFGPGDIVIYDSGRGYEARANDFDVRVVMVPRERAPALFLTPAVHGLTFRAARSGRGRPADYGTAASISVECADQAEVDRLWTALIPRSRPAPSRLCRAW